jgi:hypothetical protein
LVGKHEEKRPLRRPRHIWDDIRIYLMEKGWKVVDGMHLAQDRDHRWALVNMVMNLQVP